MHRLLNFISFFNNIKGGGKTSLPLSPFNFEGKLSSTNISIKGNDDPKNRPLPLNSKKILNFDLFRREIEKEDEIDYSLIATFLMEKYQTTETQIEHFVKKMIEQGDICEIPKGVLRRL